MTPPKHELPAPRDGAARAYEITPPTGPRRPIVLASPHSGTDYAAEFTAPARLTGDALRRSEDSFVDEIFAGGPALGAPLLKAHFPRAFVDPNREPFELDPTMFADTLPPHVNTASPRVAAGLGTIPRVVASGEPIYARKLTFAEAESRVMRFYMPYHAALRRLVDETLAAFGYAILLDCHSMPSSGVMPDGEAGRAGADIVLGDCYGTACDPVVIETAERALRARGYRVARNAPYAGGYTTRHYGRPGNGVHALQIEINRALYMDERHFQRSAGMAGVTRDMTALVEAVGAIPSAKLTIAQAVAGAPPLAKASE